jgi:hypothetical protein
MTMTQIVDFLKGAAHKRVDYATRHYSKAYDRGQTFGWIMVLFVIPLSIVFAAGFALGKNF